MAELSELLKGLLASTEHERDEARNRVIMLVELVGKMLPLVDWSGVSAGEFEKLWPAECRRWMNLRNGNLLATDAREVSKAARTVLACIASQRKA